MDLNRSLEEFFRLTAEVIHESHMLKQRAREAMSQSDAVISQSRKLLSLWPASGTPTLPAPELREEEPKGATAREDERKGTAVAVTPEAKLERVAERDFVGETVRLDGRHFVDCKLESCTLEYSGGPVILEGTHFSGCGFQFGGEAAMTVSVLECFGLVGAETGASARSPRPPGGNGRVN